MLSIERVDRLRDQYATAIACFHTSSRLVVVGLRAPPWHHHCRRLDLPEATVAQHLMQTLAAWPEAHLKADAEAAMRLPSRGDKLLAALYRYLQRLLAQHMPASSECGLRDRQMRVRRCQHHHRIDRRIRDGTRDVGGGGETIAVRDVVQPRLAARRGPDHTHAIGKIDQRTCMRLQRVAQAYDGNADH
jgi:hypothetical protein